jgi:hypothetical protein
METYVYKRYVNATVCLNMIFSIASYVRIMLEMLAETQVVLYVKCSILLSVFNKNSVVLIKFDKTPEM